jgi:tripartite-type tricarboxylate transporter receptor subunit TctC
MPTFPSLSRRRIVAAGVSAAGAANAPAARSQSWPARNLVLVNPYAPGGGVDPVARLFATKLSERLGQPVVVENRTGAAGAVGANSVAKARPDGYTLLMSAASEITVAPHLLPNVPYKPDRDLQPIAQIVRLPLLLVAHPSLPVASASELVAYLKKNPAKVNFASAGSGSVQHLAMEMVKSMTNTYAVHIPYRGVAPAVADVLAGQVQMTFAGFPTAIQHVKAGRLKALGVSSFGRMAQAPEIPTINEQGLPGYNVIQWFGFFAPAGTPPDIVERLNREANTILAMPDVKTNLASQGAEPVGGSGAALAELIKKESAGYARLIKTAKITAD